MSRTTWARTTAAALFLVMSRSPLAAQATPPEALTGAGIHAPPRSAPPPAALGPPTGSSGRTTRST